MYFSSSGPGTSRSITFCEDVLMLREDCTLEKNKYSKPPVRTAVKISEEATNDLNEYALAFKELEEAQRKFAFAKKVFMESEGGKELITILRPQKDQLRPSDVFNTGDINVLIKEIEDKGDCTVTSTVKEVHGYNAGTVKFTLNKPVLLDRINKIVMGDYTYAKHGYSFKYENHGYSFKYENGQKIVETAVFEKAGRQYPPYREDDYFEVAKAELEMREKLDQ